MPSISDTNYRRVALAGLLLTLALTGCNGDLSKGAGVAPEPQSTVAANGRTSSAAPSERLDENPPEDKTLTWQAPLTREDGSSLYPGEIGGYRIYFRLNHQDQLQVLQVKDPFKTSLSLADFAPGVYRFSISTIDINGLESRRSDAIRVDVT